MQPLFLVQGASVKSGPQLLETSGLQTLSFRNHTSESPCVRLLALEVNDRTNLIFNLRAQICNFLGTNALVAFFYIVNQLAKPLGVGQLDSYMLVTLYPPGPPRKMNNPLSAWLSHKQALQYNLYMGKKKEGSNSKKKLVPIMVISCLGTSRSLVFFPETGCCSQGRPAIRTSPISQGVLRA